ncbi:hypothetical protein RSAG8_11866, partial [Rhizoctonia solani AG-8 WAC10335]
MTSHHLLPRPILKGTIAAPVITGLFSPQLVSLLYHSVFVSGATQHRRHNWLLQALPAINLTIGITYQSAWKISQECFGGYRLLRNLS